MRKFFLILIVFCFGAAGFVAFEAFRFLNTPPSTSEDTVIFEVKPGPFYRITNELAEKKLISNRRYFVLYAKLKQQITKVKTGEYELRKNMTPEEVLAKLVSGKVVQYEFTIQEGLNIYEIAQVLEENKLADKTEFLRLEKKRSFIRELLNEELPSLEGYLFPDTYRVTKYEGEQAIIKAMVDNFLSVYRELVQAYGPHPKFSRNELVTLASMIEKETGAPFERPRISSVFLNRLNKRMRLQSDPTILYGIMETHGYWKKNIQKKDIREKTAYNTYRVNALPKGPIANPGKESLRAVFKPETTDYLYFVSKNDGTHHFSKTYKEHQRAVVRFQKNSSARKGKSWRDLKTNK